MADWTPPPEPISWSIKPVAIGTTTYSSVTLRAPTPADILKATAMPGEGGVAVALRMISAISAESIPFEGLLQVPQWQIEQMTNYFELFNGAPMPAPLAAYLAPPAKPASEDTAAAQPETASTAA